MSELKVTTLKHADSTVDSIVMASDGTLAFGAAVADSAGVAIQGGADAQAWVNFNGTGTVAIRATYNVSTVTDNGPGDYTVNFTTAMTDSNYCPVSEKLYLTASPAARISTSIVLTSVSSLRARSFSAVDAAALDVEAFYISVFR